MPFTDPTTSLPASDVTGPIVRETANGGRIVLDDDGAIKTYDPDGNITNYIGGDQGVMWNNAGWDPDGNPDGEWFEFNTGNLLFGTGDPLNFADTDQTKSGQLAVLGIGWAGALTSPGDKGGVYTDQASMEFMAGKPGGQSGTLDAPAFQVTNGDIAVVDNVVKLTNTFDNTSWRRVPEVWHTPSYNANWGASTTFNGTTNWGSLQYRKDAMDNLVIVGAFKAGSTAPGTAVFQLPTGYRPKSQWPVWVQRNAGGTLSGGYAGVSSSGNVNLLAGAGVGVAAGSEYLINAVIPLGNIA